MTQTIIYNNNLFNVTNPGKLLYNNKGQLLNQLSLELIPFSRKRKEFLRKNYNISEEDYYIIVVLYGKKENLPKCSFIDPITKEQCTCFKKFRTLVPKKGIKDSIFYDGCENHLRSATGQINQLKLFNEGRCNLLFTNRRDKEWRRKLSESAKKQIKDGNSIFSDDSVRREDIKSVKYYNEGGFYSNKLKEIGINRSLLNTKSDYILADKLIFLSNGNEDDMCYYYMTELEGNSEVIKFGVTNNPNRRGEGTEYHGYFYKNYKIIRKDSRKIISELEYSVKMHFISDIILGNEGFVFSKKDDIINFINNFKN